MSRSAGFEELIDFAAGKSDGARRTARAFVPLLGGMDEAAAPVFDRGPPVPEPEPEPPPIVEDLPPVAPTGDAAAAKPGSATTQPAEPDILPPAPSAPAAEPAPDPAALTARIEELEAGIVSLNERHLSEMTQKVAQAIAALGERVTADVSAELALVLEDALLTRAQAEAVSRFADELGQLITVGGGARVTVTGPDALLDALRATWKGPAPLPELIAGDSLDLVARMDDALLATRFAALRDALCGDDV